MASQFTFEAIGTHWVIDIVDDLSPEREANILQQIMYRINIFDKDYSRFRSDSLITEISKKVGIYKMPDDAGPLFSVYKKMYDATGGLFTPLIGQVLVDAGYDANYSLDQNRELEKPPSWEESLDFDEKNNLLKIKIPVLLDFGAAGKGYLIDIVGDILKKNKIVSYTVDAGGDILHRSQSQKHPLRVGLEHPQDMSQVIGVANILDKSIAGSAGNRRVWKNFHHIIDPMKLSSPIHILAVWVVADSTMVADAIATCLYFVTADILKNKLTDNGIFDKKYDFEYVIINADFSVEKSAGFPGEIFVQ